MNCDIYPDKPLGEMSEAEIREIDGLLDLSDLSEQAQTEHYRQKFAIRAAAEQAYRNAWEAVELCWWSLSPEARQFLEPPGEVPFF
jgi:hypothetical protein